MIQSGPETDLAVARAVGDAQDEHDWTKIGSGYVDSAYICDRCKETTFGDEPLPKHGCHRHYSTDLNDAFMAAEKFNPYKNWPSWVFFQQYYLRQTYEGQWCMSSHDIDGDYNNFGTEEAPALAICAAILKLAESK